MEGRDNKGRFIKGRIESSEEKIKRLKASRKAWKEREEYIGDLVNECPRIYNSWRAFMFTDKGKKIGHSKEWSNFKQFYADVRNSYQNGFVLRRPDISKPFSKDNFMWLSPEEANKLPNSVTILIEYNGETHTIIDWADKLGISKYAIQNRYHRYKDIWSVEDILYGKKIKRNSKTPKDITEIEADKIRAKASKMISSYNKIDIRKNFGKSDLTIEWIIENILTKSCVYCGDTYRIGCDRINNDKGHTKNNVVPCCYECNTARNSNFSYEEMKLLGKTIREIKLKRKKRDIPEINTKEVLSHNIEYRKKRCCRKTYQFDEQKHLVKEYDSVKDAALAITGDAKSITAACTGHGSGEDKHKYKLFYWSHDKNFYNERTSNN